MISGVGNEAWILPWNARKHFMLSRWLIIEVAATCSCLQTEHDVDPSRSANFWKSDFALEIKSSLLLNSAKCFFSSFWNDASSCGSRAVMGSIIPSLVPTSALTITSVSSERLLNNKDFLHSNTERCQGKTLKLDSESRKKFQADEWKRNTRRLSQQTMYFLEWKWSSQWCALLRQ